MISVRKCIDGKYRRWQTVAASSLRPLEPDEIDGPVAVITGVFARRKDAYEAEGPARKAARKPRRRRVAHVAAAGRS